MDIAVPEAALEIGMAQAGTEITASRLAAAIIAKVNFCILSSIVGPITGDRRHDAHIEFLGGAMLKRDRAAAGTPSPTTFHGEELDSVALSFRVEAGAVDESD